MAVIDEFIRSCRELGEFCQELDKKDGAKIINLVLDKFRPNKISGHLSIYRDSLSIPLEKHEFSYSSNLKKEPILIFFDQERYPARVIYLENGNRLGEILENAYGMEYFITNESVDYLLAVNWYVIEGSGTVKELLEKLSK